MIGTVQAARGLVLSNFPATVVPDVLEAVGLDPLQVLGADDPPAEAFRLLEPRLAPVDGRHHLIQPSMLCGEVIASHACLCCHKRVGDDHGGWPLRLPIAAALLASLTLLVGCGASAGNKGAASSASSVSGSASPGKASSSTMVGPVTASLPVVSCPTSSGVVRPAVPSPRSRSVVVPQALAGKLSVYADTQGVMELVGPKGWTCTASYGADGSGGITVHPLGGGPSPRSAIVGSETSACVGCALDQACRLFPSAARALRSDLGEACPIRRAAAERVVRIAAGIVAFEDPPGVKGTGALSGGQYPAYGVMTYHPPAPDGSWQETCTLPSSDKSLCTAVLNSFVSWYGQR
jgi:Domain of unknown function (DUF4850)